MKNLFRFLFPLFFIGIASGSVFGGKESEDFDNDVPKKTEEFFLDSSSESITKKLLNDHFPDNLTVSKLAISGNFNKGIFQILASNCQIYIAKIVSEEDFVDEKRGFTLVNEARLDHLIVTPEFVLNFKDLHILVMKKVEGECLNTEKWSHFSPEVIQSFADNILEISQKNVLHWDLHFNNIFFNDENQFFQIIDTGRIKEDGLF